MVSSLALVIGIFQFSTQYFASDASEVEIRTLKHHAENDEHYLHFVKDGNDHHFLLRRPQAEESVLHDNLVIADAYTDERGELQFDAWTPDEEFKLAANDIYIDSNNHAAFRIKTLEDGTPTINGFTKRFAIHHDGTSHYTRDYETPKRPTNDAVQVPNYALRNDTVDAPETRQIAENVVELLILADKALCDYFGQNRRRVLDYFTTVMYDNMLRYQTLKSVKVTFRVSAIVLNQNTGSQPYIENSRIDGKVDFMKVLDNVGTWLYENKGRLPAFDMATVPIRAETTWGGGLAWGGAVCYADEGGKKNYNTFVYSEAGDWTGPIFLSHESAHNLGAPHDDDDDKKVECGNVKGYIMSGGSPDLQYYFSDCSDRYITNTLKDKACLRQINNNRPELTSFTNPKAPSMDAVCKRRLNDNGAYVAEVDQSNCKVLKCRSSNGQDRTQTYLVDNMICKTGGRTGRCFRGTCRT